MNELIDAIVGEIDRYAIDGVICTEIYNLDEYVDVYKITGRYLLSDHIFGLLDLYIRGEDCSFKDMFVSRDAMLDFPTSLIPDRLMFCNYEQCGHGCDPCETVIEKGIAYVAAKMGSAG